MNVSSLFFICVIRVNLWLSFFRTCAVGGISESSHSVATGGGSDVFG